MTDVKMTYMEFLQTTKVLRMLYGYRVSKQFFEKNKKEFKMLDSIDILKLEAQSDVKGDKSPHG